MEFGNDYFNSRQFNSIFEDHGFSDIHPSIITSMDVRTFVVDFKRGTRPCQIRIDLYDVMDKFRANKLNTELESIIIKMKETFDV